MKTEENIVTFINNLEAENQDIECKQCKRILPKDLWSTYSAFANTHGGKIILGITEIKNIEKNKFEITGVENPTKVGNNPNIQRRYRLFILQRPYQR